MNFNDEMMRPFGFLQLFAEGDGAGATENGNGGGTEGDGAAAGDNENGALSFDDFLKQEGNQAEFDRRVQKALNTQRSKLENEYQANLAGAKKEAEKLAKMNEQQKQSYELEKSQKEKEALEQKIAELEREANRTALGREAAKTLKEQHGITADQDILEFVVGDNAEETNKLIEKFVGIIQNDRKQVEVSRATGRTPKAYGGSGNPVSEIEKRIAKYQ